MIGDRNRDFCADPQCGHHVDSHANIPRDDGGCMNRHCHCEQFRHAWGVRGQRGSEAGCYS